MSRVVIIGGGVAGMSAAHELIERNYEVEVYETNSIYIGGKARSIDVPDTNLKEPNKFLPGEHGFRFFPGFYRHITDTMKRIPFKNKEGKLIPGGTFSNLCPTISIMLARYGKGSISVNARFPRTRAGWKLLLKNLFHGVDTGLTTEEMTFFTARMMQLATSCRRRRDENYEKLGWWEYMQADKFSDTYRSLLVEGLTRTLVAANAETASTKTGGDIVLQLIYSAIQPWVNPDRVLNAPTNDAWLTPWKDYLTHKGVVFHLGSMAHHIELKAGKIDHVTIKRHRVKEGRESKIKVKGDYYLFACPVEQMAKLVTKEMIDIDPCFNYILELAPSVSWMNGIQYYLNENVKVNDGHIIFSDTEWALTAISQVQFWGDYKLSDCYNGKVKGILSVDISDWKITPYKGMLAKDCDAPTVEKYVWEQLEKSLNVNGKQVIDRSMIEFYYIDRDIHWNKKSRQNVNREPLLVNKVNTWALRPTAATHIENLFLASDYVRTNTDLATMEGANEASRRAVNCIIDADGNSHPYAQIFKFNEPWFFLPKKWWDMRRYNKGLPYNEEFPWWIILITSVIGLLFIIEGFFKFLYGKLMLSGQEGFVRTTIFFTLSCAALAAWLNWGIVSAFILGIGMFVLFVFYAYRQQDIFLKKLILFGIVAGCVEMCADLLIVEDIKTIIYPPDEIMIWDSPVYMPFLWAIILIQVGYLGYLFTTRFRMLTTFFLTFISGVLFIFTLDILASHASWWEYNPTGFMVFNIPFYMLIGGGLICSVLPFIFIKARKMRWISMLIAGILMGIWIFLAYLISYQVLG